MTVNFAGVNKTGKTRSPIQFLPYPKARELRELYKSQNGICGLCNLSMNAAQHLDHILQLQYGGAHVLQNLRFVHWFCNLERQRIPPKAVTVLRLSEDTGEHTDAKPW